MKNQAGRFCPGDRVRIGDGEIEAVVEEVVFARNMIRPLYVVEWWQDGDLRSRRLHEEDLG